MKYRIIDGIVYTKVCGIPLLIATRKAWDICPPVKELSPLKSVFWQSIEKGMDEEALMEVIILPPRLKKETVQKRYKQFLYDMEQAGYLIQENNDDVP